VPKENLSLSLNKGKKQLHSDIKPGNKLNKSHLDKPTDETNLTAEPNRNIKGRNLNPTFKKVKKIFI
jgi:hypothetical protein